MNDPGGTDPALELILLVETKGSISRPGPPGGVGQGNVTIGWFHIEQWFSSIIGTGSVVGDEKEECIFELTVFPEIFDKPAHFLVDTINHRGQRYHAIDLVVLLPGDDLVPGADMREGGGSA